MCQCEKALISLLQRERERERAYGGQQCVHACAGVHIAIGLCLCVYVCKSVSSLCTTRKLVIYNNKTVLPLFFLLYCNLLCFFCFLCFLFTSCTCSHTHILVLSFLYALCVCVCVCKCKLETETGLLVQMRALFFFRLFLLQQATCCCPPHTPSLAQSSCFCYALVTVRKLQLLLWLRVGGNDQQMTNFILCHLMMTTSTHKIQQEQEGERGGDQTSFSRSKFLAVTPQLPCCCSRCVVVVVFVGFIAFYVLCWK